MPNETNDGIPEFLIIPQEERRQAWVEFRARKILPPEQKQPMLPIGDLPDVEKS